MSNCAPAMAAEIKIKQRKLAIEANTMEPNTAGENSTTIPSIPSLSNVSTPTNQDQQQQEHQQQQQPIVQQEQQQQQVEQNQNHQTLASHFHLSHLVESLGDAIDNGTRDQHSDALINELSNHFEKCQQLLNSIGASLSTKDMTVEEQNKKLEESEQLLNQRRDLIANFRSTVEDLAKTEP